MKIVQHDLHIANHRRSCSTIFIEHDKNFSKTNILLYNLTMQYKRLFIENSYVFITIVTAKRRKILLKNIQILREAFKRTIQSFNYEIYAICILPEHIHMIIKPYDINDYPKIIQQIKRYFSQKIDKQNIDNYSLTSGNVRRKERDIWQHRYWEHTIRDINDLYKHLDYIHYNPIKHDYTNKAKDWEFSSFNKFVKQHFYELDWCNFDNINKINELNYE